MAVLGVKFVPANHAYRPYHSLAFSADQRRLLSREQALRVRRIPKTATSTGLAAFLFVDMEFIGQLLFDDLIS